MSWKIDRFSRQTEAALRDLRRLEGADARLAFVVEDIDTGTTYGRMVYTILLAVSEAFLENIKAGWEITKARAVERGAYISRTPWGYRRCDDSTLEPHPERAAIVSEAFRIAAGDSLNAAMDYLLRVAPERTWTTTKVRRLLSQRSYLGETRNGNMVALDTHAPLVSRAVFEAAQTTPRGKGPSERFPLSGLLRCKTCGNTMIGGRGGNKQRTYRCTATTVLFQGEKCPKGATVVADRVETYLREIAEVALTGMVATVSDPDADALTLLERAVSDAEAELDAFAGDLQMRSALGNRYHGHLQARVNAVERARVAYRASAREANESLRLTGPEILEDPEMLPVVLRSMFDSVQIVPGRGMKIEDRVRLIPLDADRSSGMLAAQSG